MSWYLVINHAVGHLVPSIVAGGSVSAGRSEFQLFNPDNLDARTKVAAASEFVVDRGASAGTRTTINSVIVMAHDLAYNSRTLKVESHNTTTPPTTEFLAAVTPAQDDWYWYYNASGNTNRHWSISISGACEIGCVSFGYAVDLGNPKLGRTVSTGDGAEGRTITGKFTGLTYAQMEAVTEQLSLDYIRPSRKWLVDGLGGNGGKRPMALYDGTNSRLYWGYVKASISEWKPGYYVLNVTLREKPFGLGGLN